jgi:hypothetical protein
LFSVYEFISVVCERSILYSSDVFDCVMNSSRHCKFKIRGRLCKTDVGTMSNPQYNPRLRRVALTRRWVPAMTLKGLQRLLVALDKRVAADVRPLVEGVLERSMAGDASAVEGVPERREKRKRGRADGPSEAEQLAKRKRERADGPSEAELLEGQVGVLKRFGLD